MIVPHRCLISIVSAAVFGCWLLSSFAEAAPEDAPSQAEKRPASKSPDPPGTKRLSPEYDVWIDSKNKRVIVDGEVCLRQGQLEMFACLKGTKEHESIISVDAKAFIIHAGLLAVGAKQGTPVEFQPEYKPATGATIDVTCIWTDEAGKVRHAKAHDWIQNVETKKPMELDWVFAGSRMYKDETTGQEFYQAEGGELICVSNFPSAMLDLPVESSQANNALLFQAFTEKIPPRGTKVRLVLTPRPEKADKPVQPAPATSRDGNGPKRK
jgi:hypothetical protein